VASTRKGRRKDVQEDFRTCLLDRLVSGENTVGTTAAPAIQDHPEDDSESEAKEISGQWAIFTVHSEGGDHGAFAPWSPSFTPEYDGLFQRI
jgi:hypothetical protein